MARGFKYYWLLAFSIVGSLCMGAENPAPARVVKNLVTTVTGACTAGEGLPSGERVFVCFPETLPLIRSP